MAPRRSNKITARKSKKARGARKRQPRAVETQKRLTAFSLRSDEIETALLTGERAGLLEENAERSNTRVCVA